MKDKIWFTYKARIQAHKRLEWLDFHSQMLLVWYAILSTILGVLTIRHQHVLGPNTDIISVILSVALLGVSLAVTNRDFRGRAMVMRRNYLELQKLYNEIFATSTPPTQEQINRYNDLLAESENHSEIDDQIARFFSNGLTSRKPTWHEGVSVICWLSLRQIVSCSLYLLPLISALYAWSIK